MRTNIPHTLYTCNPLTPCPPGFTRGVVLEAMGRFDEAVADYRAVLAAAPNDPAAWNNLGNATGGEW